MQTVSVGLVLLAPFEAQPVLAQQLRPDYELGYVGSTYLGQSIVLTNNFTNPGLSMMRITGLFVEIDGICSNYQQLCSYSPLTGLPANLTTEQEIELDLTASIPINTWTGNHTVTSSIYWQYVNEISAQWVIGDTFQVQESLLILLSPGFSGLWRVTTVTSTVVVVIMTLGLTAVLIYIAVKEKQRKRVLSTSSNCVNLTFLRQTFNDPMRKRTQPVWLRLSSREHPDIGRYLIGPFHILRKSIVNISQRAILLRDDWTPSLVMA